MVDLKEQLYNMQIRYPLQSNIETERLIISSLDCNNTDIHDMFLWNDDVEIQKYLHMGLLKSEYNFRRYFVNMMNSGQKIYIAKLKNTSNNDVICCYRIVAHNFSIWFCNPKYRGNGYTSEMVSAIINALDLHNVTAHIDSKNIASQRVAEKAGFTLVDARPNSKGLTQIYVKRN